MALQRTVKNVVNNYSPIECKVREATSNDPSGPSLLLMEEISQSTNQVIAVPEIMNMLYKRLNDSGKNWRHVYKSLQLLDYLLKNGHESITAQCLENISIITNLLNFHYVENYRDHGELVRKKAAQIVQLLSDLTLLISEREKAMEIKRSRSNNSAVHNYLGSPTTSSQSFSIQSKDHVYPSSKEEEDIQIEIALKNSLDEAKVMGNKNGKVSPDLIDSSINTSLKKREFTPSSSNNDVLINFDSNETPPPVTTKSVDPFDLFDASWAPTTQNTNIDPWSANQQSNLEKITPVSPICVLEKPKNSGCPDNFIDFFSNNSEQTNVTKKSDDPFLNFPLTPSKPATMNVEENSSKALVPATEAKKDSKPNAALAFLGDIGALVNVDNLLTPTNRQSGTNPFAPSSSQAMVPKNQDKIPNNTALCPKFPFNPVNNPNNLFNGNTSPWEPKAFQSNNPIFPNSSPNNSWMQPTPSIPNQQQSSNPFL